MNETILQALRLAVENKYGHALTTRRDFDALVAMIEEDCHEHLSSTTIRRFWGYQKDQKSQISMTSLDILADYCGYRTFHNFEKEHSDVITNNEEQSGFITSPTWTTQNGVNGYKVTSRTNGNSIFLPAAGVRGGSYLYDVGGCGGYWSSSLYSNDSSNACSLNFDSGNVYWNGSSRCGGRSGRSITEYMFIL